MLPAVAAGKADGGRKPESTSGTRQAFQVTRGIAAAAAVQRSAVQWKKRTMPAKPVAPTVPDPVHRGHFMASLMLRSPPTAPSPARPGGASAAPRPYVRRKHQVGVPSRPPGLRGRPVTPNSPRDWCRVLLPAADVAPAVKSRVDARSNLLGQAACVTRRGLVREEHVVRGEAPPPDQFDPELEAFGGTGGQPLESTTTGPHFRAPTESPVAVIPVSGTRTAFSPMPLPPSSPKPPATSPARHPARFSPMVAPGSAGTALAAVAHSLLTPPPNPNDPDAHSTCSDDACHCHCDCQADLERFYSSGSDSDPDWDAVTTALDYETQGDVLGSRNASRYLAQCEELKTTPDASGFALDPMFSAAEDVDLSASGLGLRFVQSVHTALPGLGAMRRLSLAQNRLDNAAVTLLMRCLPANVTSLDLSGNLFGVPACKALEAALTTKALSVNDLNLSGNRIGSLGCTIVLLANLKVDKLRAVNLSSCGLDKACGSALYRTIVDCVALQELGLGWNSLRPALPSITDAMAANDSITVLDLSWNSLGNTASVDGVAGLCGVLKANTTLTHLDLSNNRLNVTACTLLAAALNGNHTLMGLHVNGNDCQLDEAGFMVAGNQGDTSFGHAHVDIMGSSGFEAPTVRSLGLCRNCWVCEGWTMVTFKYSPGVSGPGGQRITVHCSVDNWAAEVMAPELVPSTRPARPSKLLHVSSEKDLTAAPPRKQSRHPSHARVRSDVVFGAPSLVRESSIPGSLEDSDSDGEDSGIENMLDELKAAPEMPVYTARRMLPPGTLEYVFVVDGAHQDALDQPARPTTHAGVVLKLGMLRTGTTQAVASGAAADMEDDGSMAPAVGQALVPVKDASGLTAAMAAEYELKRYLPPHATVNYMTVPSSKPGNAEGGPGPRNHKSLSEVQRRGVKEDFNLQASVFASLVLPTGDGYRQRMEVDFQRTKCKKVVKDDDELYRIRKLLGEHMGVLCDVFRDCAAVGKHAIQIGWQGFSDLLKGCGIADDVSCNLKAMDSIFIISNVEKPGVALRNNNSRALMRHEFLESLIRVAMVRWVSSGIVRSPAVALEKLIKMHLLPLAKRTPMAQWCRTRLFNSGVDAVVKKNLAMLHSLFGACGETVRLGRRRTILSLDSYLDVFADAKILTNRMHIARLAFARAKSFAVDDQAAPFPLTLSFPEFIVAVCHVADIRDGKSSTAKPDAFAMSMVATLAKGRMRGRRASLDTKGAAKALARRREAVKAAATAAAATVKPTGAAQSKEAEGVAKPPPRKPTGRSRSASVDSNAALLIKQRLLGAKVSHGPPAPAVEGEDALLYLPSWEGVSLLPLSVKLLPVLDALRAVHRRKGLHVSPKRRTEGK